MKDCPSTKRCTAYDPPLSLTHDLLLYVRPNHGQGLDIAEGEGGDGVEADIELLLLRGGRQTRKLKIRVVMFYRIYPNPLFCMDFMKCFQCSLNCIQFITMPASCCFTVLQWLLLEGFWVPLPSVMVGFVSWVR